MCPNRPKSEKNATHNFFLIGKVMISKFGSKELNTRHKLLLFKL